MIRKIIFFLFFSKSIFNFFSLKLLIHFIQTATNKNFDISAEFFILGTSKINFFFVLKFNFNIYASYKQTQEKEEEEKKNI